MKQEIELISEYLLGDEYYKDAVRSLIKNAISGLGAYRLLVKWANDTAFPEITCISIIINNEKYIYHPGRSMRNFAGKFSNIVVQCISYVNKIVERTFVILQKYVMRYRQQIKDGVQLSLLGELHELKLDKFTFVMPFVNGFHADETPHGYAYYCGVCIYYSECINSELNSLLAIGGILQAINKLGEKYEQLSKVGA